MLASLDYLEFQLELSRHTAETSDSGWLTCMVSVRSPAGQAEGLISAAIQLGGFRGRATTDRKWATACRVEVASLRRSRRAGTEGVLGRAYSMLSSH